VRRFRIALAICFIALGLLAATFTRAIMERGPTEFAPYAPLPHQATSAVGVTFVRLRPFELARVRVSAPQALAAAIRWEAFSGNNPHVTVDLGAFADSKKLPTVLAYLVIFDGVIVPNLGPKQERPNHEDIAVINAVTGHAIEGFSYR
jgi:hypothetical protein